MEIPRKPRSPRTARIKAAKALKKVPTALLLKKKAECDSKALKIVEEMIEPGIDPNWLLQNLGQINKAHMDDIVEERSIVKLCGYPLCDNPLKKVIQKQYQISTLRNKVYDVSRLKNFCSYRCYTATEYLMEQMLTSPLWVRDDEEIPKFQILPKTQSRSKSPPGVEVDLAGIKLPDDADDPEEPVASASNEKRSEKSCPSAKKLKTCDSGEMKHQETDKNTGEESVNDTEVQRIRERFESCSIAKDEGKLKETETKNWPTDVEMAEVEVVTKKLSEVEIQEEKLPDVIEKKPRVSFSAKVSEEKNEPSTSRPIGPDSSVPKPARKNVSESRKTERRKDRESKKKAISFETLTSRVEASFKEWITEETICLLHGEETEKRKIMENVSRQEKYAVLCKKLNHLQLEEEREDADKIGDLKPAPQFSALKEEAKSLELKVRAFFEGRTVIEPTVEKATDPAKQEDDEQQTEAMQLPLLDLHAPKALRRRIFLDKLNRVLPDLLRALVGTGSSSSTQYSYTSERCAAVKALVSTFSLSATNITFKTAEWTLVGLIIIKLLSFVDPRMKFLLSSKQASMYTSMILMSYKLDSNYLETLIVATSPPTPTVDEDS